MLRWLYKVAAQKVISDLALPLFQSESWCSSFHMKISFIYMWMKTNFHMRGWAPGLAFKKEPKANLEMACWFLLELRAPKCCWGAEYLLPSQTYIAHRTKTFLQWSRQLDKIKYIVKLCLNRNLICKSRLLITVINSKILALWLTFECCKAKNASLWLVEEQIL